MEKTISIGMISIMMPAYNAERYIAQAVDSALAQTYPDWELIVIDDGSTDRTSEILAGYTDPRIKVFHQANGGEAAARNAALDQTSGQYLAFLDADDLFQPEHLETAAVYFHDHPEHQGLYTDGMYIDQDGKPLKPLSARRRGPFVGDIFEHVMRSSDVFGAPLCVFLTRQVITQYNLRFDPGIVIGPDWDFLVQYAEKAQFGCSSKITCHYRVHQTNISLRTNLEKRTRSLARCREKSIHMARFGECSPETRYFVFYDLLLNQLKEKPERQAEIIHWPAFRQLSSVRQAQLLRLMAGALIARGQSGALAGEWLSLAVQANPKDYKTVLLSLLYRLNPQLCKILLCVKKTSQPDAGQVSPFADLFSS